MTVQRFFLIFVIVFSVVSCGSTNQTQNKFKRVDFAVDLDLLSQFPAVVEEAFEICFPEDFVELDELNFKVLKSAIDSDSTSFFPLSLQSVYQSQDGCASLLSRIVSDVEVFDKLGSEYSILLTENFSTDNVHRGKLRINNINTVQYIVTNSDIVLIKLLFLVNRSYFQLDYIIPFTVYESKLKSIESSIGSIIIKAGENDEES
jgi:hypothetical protein